MLPARKKYYRSSSLMINLKIPHWAFSICRHCVGIDKFLYMYMNDIFIFIFFIIDYYFFFSYLYINNSFNAFFIVIFIDEEFYKRRFNCVLMNVRFFFFLILIVQLLISFTSKYRRQKFITNSFRCYMHVQLYKNAYTYTYHIYMYSFVCTM